MKDLLTWPIIGGLAVLVLLIVVFALFASLRRVEMRNALGLPADTKLGEAEEQMFQAFKDTDMRLAKSMPKLSKTQRRLMVQEVLRRKGLLPGHAKRG
jgi:hypothetical protein